MLKKKLSKAQSTLEYVVLVSVIIAALILLQTYIKRGVQGKLRDSTDDIASQFDLGKTTVHSETGRTAKTVQTVAAGETNTYSDAREGSAADVYTEKGTEDIATWVEEPAP